ncbi:hypothetical protein ACERII_25500 [Evansella sp. AB-rgal1]|uniref:hypothetical protein n=1 Tax=Evansella sp. AB-rgal1 TaxID=3242696 RepID=UPI00359E154F
MSKVTLQRGTVAILLCVITFLVYIKNINGSELDQHEIMARYYEVISKVEKLYGNHQHADGEFYNGSLDDIAKVEEFLRPYMTEETVSEVINHFFRESEDLLVYAGNFQDYLLTSRESYYSPNLSEGYYSLVRDTILNPGLKLVLDEQITINKKEDKYIIEIDDITIRYYNESEGMYHYSRLGFPPSDCLRATFTFITRDGELVLSNFNVRSL